jgi:hypothetical protein
MTIETSSVGTSNTTVYTSTGNNAITLITLCNYSIGNETVSVHIVPSGDGVGDDNIMLKDLPITSGDTYVIYQGGEKILLEDGDLVNVIASGASAITAITSYVAI